MTAEPAPKPDPKERADLFIASHQERYSEAITDARNAAATTATASWQAMYQSNMKTHRESVRDAADSILAECRAIKTGDTFEDTEKSIRENVKALQDERIRHQAWRARTVNPYTSAVDKCAAIRAAAIAAAEETERKQPLIDRGLAPEVRARIDKWPTAKWDEDTGVIDISG